MEELDGQMQSLLQLYRLHRWISETRTPKSSAPYVGERATMMLEDFMDNMLKSYSEVHTTQQLPYLPPPSALLNKQCTLCRHRCFERQGSVVVRDSSRVHREEISAVEVDSRRYGGSGPSKTPLRRSRTPPRRSPRRSSFTEYASSFSSYSASNSLSSYSAARVFPDRRRRASISCSRSRLSSSSLVGCSVGGHTLRSLANNLLQRHRRRRDCHHHGGVTSTIWRGSYTKGLFHHALHSSKPKGKRRTSCICKKRSGQQSQSSGGLNKFRRRR